MRCREKPTFIWEEGYSNKNTAYFPRGAGVIAQPCKATFFATAAAASALWVIEEAFARRRRGLNYGGGGVGAL